MGATSTKSKVTFLETVYPPIANQQAVWLLHEPEVEALLRHSDFYMMGDRAEAKYLNLMIHPDTYIVTFDFAIGDNFRDPVESPEYNVVKFASYPNGVDGLYGSDFVRYGYAICQAVSFNTAHGWIRGRRALATGLNTNDADSIFVEGRTVRLFLSGVYFPAESLPAATTLTPQINQKEDNQGVYD